IPAPKSFFDCHEGFLGIAKPDFMQKLRKRGSISDQKRMANGTPCRFLNLGKSDRRIDCPLVQIADQFRVFACVEANHSGDKPPDFAHFTRSRVLRFNVGAPHPRPVSDAFAPRTSDFSRTLFGMLRCRERSVFDNSSGVYAGRLGTYAE